MTEQNQNKPSLSELYRRFGGQRAAPVVPDADDLLALAHVEHAEQAASPVCADLLRFSRELESVSAQLSADVNAAFEATPHTHRRDINRRVAASAQRRWRGVAAVAASVLAVVGVWTLQRGHVAPPSDVAHNTALPDRIFVGSLDERSMASVPAKDVIFRDQFSSSAAPDEIFRYHD